MDIITSAHTLGFSKNMAIRAMAKYGHNPQFGPNPATAEVDGLRLLGV